MPRTRMEYGGCSVMKRSRPRRSATHCASTICSAGNVELPKERILPWCTRSLSARAFLIDVDRLVGAVDLVQVDVVDTEPAKAVLAPGHDPTPRVALRIGIVAHRGVDLRREHDSGAVLRGERLADDDLGLARRVTSAVSMKLIPASIAR